MVSLKTTILRGIAPFALVAAVLVVGAMKPVATSMRNTVGAAMYNPTGCGSTSWNSPQCRAYQQSVAMGNTMGWGTLSPFYSLPYFPMGGVVSPYQTGPVMQPYFVAPNAYNWPAAYSPGFDTGWGYAPQPTFGYGSAAF